VPDYIIGDNTRKDNRTYNELGLMPDGTYYKDQVDNYQQNHYQLLYDQKLSDKYLSAGPCITPKALVITKSIKRMPM
jgi:iron complex outermembrane receptor protein